MASRARKVPGTFEKRAPGSVTGTDFVVCSSGKFQRGRRDEIQVTNPNVKHDLVSFVAVVVLLTLVTQLMKLQWATKVLGHLPKKLIFERLGHIFPPPPPPNNVDFSISSTAQATAPTQH